MKFVLGIVRCVILLLVSGTLSLPAVLPAQRLGDFEKATLTLPSDAQMVMHRLEKLRELPDGPWRMHAGDLMHGEANDVDTSGWQLIAPGFKAPNEAVWFRQTYTIPETLGGYDLTGARIWFDFHAGANGPMPEIYYFNGRRVALGEDLEPMVLVEKAKPGDTVVVAVKLLHTVDTKTIRGATLRIDIPETRPNPVDLWQEILSAAVMVPSLAPADKTKMQTVLDAIAAVDVKALDAHDQAKFDASIKAAEGKLSAIKPTLQQATYHLDGNGHIDAAWLWPTTETVDVVKRTFSTATQLMYEYPGYTYSQSAAAYNEWMVDKYPELNAEIAQRVKEGRWEIVGGMWVEPDLNMPDGESLVRQLLVGNRWFKKNYGVTARIGWNPDSFGYTWQLPQILKKSGLDYFVTQKMSWNDTNQFPFKLFWWESPDGSKVLTYFPHDYAIDNLNPVRLANDMQKLRTFAPGSLEMLDLYGVGDHGGGPTRAILDEGFHWAGHASSGADGTGASKLTPNYKFGGAQSFFNDVEKQIAPESPTWNYPSIAKGYTPPAAENGKITVPTWKAELYFEYHRGVMTTQANHKHNMRVSEIEALDAEKYASLAWVLAGRAYPANELTEDWKKILFNQFHDLAAGSGIGVIYKDAQKDYDVVRWSTNEISAASLAAVAAQVDTRGLELPEALRAGGKERIGTTIPVVVFNPLGWERSGEFTVSVQAPVADFTNFLVIDPADATKPSQVLATKIDTKTGAAELTIHVNNVPALGYKVLDIVPSKLGSVAGSSALDDGEKIRISENRLVVEVDKKTGCITRLEKDGFETLAKDACGNQLQFFKDLPQKYDAWNVDPGTFDVAPATVAQADSVELIGDKTPHPAIRIVRTYQSSKFVQTITIPPGSAMVDVANEIDWHERHILVKAAFALAATSNFATYEIPYGTIDRPTTRANSWEKAQFEVPAMRWADLGDGQHGLSLINQDKYGYDAVGNLLRLTLLRSPTWPDAEADQGHHSFHYALYPHAGTWKEAGTVRKGWEYSYPLTAVSTTSHAGTLPAAHSFVSVAPENVVLTAVKKAEDANGLILRVYEWVGKTGVAEFRVPAGATGATITNMSETPEGAALEVQDGVVKAPIHPYEILTVRVDYAEADKK